MTRKENRRKKKELKAKRILKKLHDRVKMEVAEDGRYTVFQRRDGNDWHAVLSTHSISKAIHRKHNAIIIAIRDLGYTPHLLEKRKKRIAQKQLRE